MISGPGAGEPDPGTEAPEGTTRERDGLGAILAVLATGLALRLIIAYLLPGSGFGVDLASFRAWADDLALHGPFGFYERPFFHDYTPGYLYVLWLMGLVWQGLAALGVNTIGPWAETDFLKLPAIAADLALGWVVFAMARELGSSRRVARLGAVLVVLNPITWFDSVVWGQVDSFGVVFLLLALRELWRDRTERAAILTMVAAVIKPQLGILVPIVAAVTIRRALWPAGGYGDEGPPARLPSDLDWERRTRGPVRILTTAVAGFATATLLALPFGLSPWGLLQQVGSTAGGYPYVSVNAWNPWALVTVDGNGIARNSLWICDALIRPVQAFQVTLGPFVLWDQPATTLSCPNPAMIGPFQAVTVGTFLLVLSFVVATWLVARRPDRRTMLVGLAVLALAFFVVPTRVHERYLFPLVAIGAILAAVSWRWRVAYVVASLAVFANMYVVLTTLYPGQNPSISDWLGIGGTLRTEPAVATVALSLLGVFLFALLQLRGGALRALGHEIAGHEPRAGDDGWRSRRDDGAADGGEPALDDSDGTGPDDAGAGRATIEDAGLAGPATSPGSPGPAGRASSPALASPGPVASSDRPATPDLPGVMEAGYGGWLRSRLFERPIRPDRSRELRGERGGRLDRLDVWVVVMLLLSVLTLRVWRLAEPYQMHFDEVYHPRTATEFLQDWRYGIDHDIYEWTHPHLAKYAMALGLIAWGDDRVNATSSIGAPILGATIEPRWDEAATASSRAGDRAYVATGTDVRAYDLATRLEVARLAIPGASAVAVDTGRHQLYIGTAGGDLLVADTLALDQLRRTAGAAPAQPASIGADTIGHATGAIRSLFSGRDGLAVVAVMDDGRVVTFSAADGRVLGNVAIAGVTQLAPGGTITAVLATTGQVTSPGQEAVTLAQIVGGSPGDLEARLRSSGPVVFISGQPTSENRTRLDEAIKAGQLPGIAVRTVHRIVVAGRDGLSFLDAETGSVLNVLDLGGPVAGVGLVQGIDDDRVYAPVETASGHTVAIVKVTDSPGTEGPTRSGQFQLPGAGGWVTYDKASQMVHILGAAPDDRAGGGQTVYVVEPHGNAVYADSPVGLAPVALAMDASERYPSADREQLLLFAGDGTISSVNVGSHAFAWRLPGVIAGAILAALLYLLARLLFQRRSVALFTAFLVVVDGMLFVQSRIGMNDSYVGMFIMAAYVLFAALWQGRWRGRRGWAAFWLLMPVLGLLLGLALASKWVAAYSIGALGILMLTRSALGRLILIAGMILATTFLGFMAITVPQGSGAENYLFLGIMVALTCVAVVATVMHPIAWSWDEQRFVTLAPAGLGILVFLVALPLNVGMTAIPVSSVTLTPFAVAGALIAATLVAHLAFLVAGRLGVGPMARRRADDDPPGLEPPAPAPEGWLRIGAGWGLPAAWAVACLVGLPLGVYVASYLPWAAMEGHQIWPGFPAGHTGQTLLDLTEQMYRYHNTLTAAHPASSPWWAWPFDLKPVWFYQEGFAGGVSASIYDAGNLVSWWLAVPALAFVSWQAYRRRSLALALIAIGFACQWVAWARIDRAAFQYHYYTSLPFVLLALAYFLAELWHGASRRTWLLARLAGGAIVLAPMVLWLLHRPLCAFVRVEAVYANSPSCPTLIPDFVLSYKALGLAVVVGLGILVLLRQFSALGRAGAAAEREAAAGLPGGRTPDWLGPLVPILLTALGTAVAQLVVGRLVPDAPLVTLRNIPVEPIAVMLLLPLLGAASIVVTARDAHRFVMGLLVAMAGWFVLWYPNIAALPLPFAMVNTYQGLLPTYVYTFQFPVSTISRDLTGPGVLSGPGLLLLGAVTLTVLVMAYSASSWRVALAEGARLRPRWSRPGAATPAPAEPTPPAEPTAPDPTTPAEPTTPEPNRPDA